MRSIRKLVASIVLCAAVIAGIGFSWRAYRAKAKLAEAARLTRQRAEQGDAQAEADLSRMYYYGRGVPQSYAEAADWSRKAADQGNAKAQYELGYIYAHGLGVTRNYEVALQWYRKAADRGSAKAQCNIGAFYYYGNGVPQDYDEAVRWYRKAAEQGQADGQEGLGFIYEHGKGAPQDLAEAARWYRKAADQGNAAAEYNLGRLYYYGHGVPQDRDEAYRWFSKAAAQGDEDADRTLSVPLTPLRKFNLVTQLLLGAWLTLNFVSFNYLVPHKSLRDFRQRVITATGVLWLIYGGLSWYGYVHHKIRGIKLYPNGFTVVRVELQAVAIAALVYTCWLRIRESEKEERARESGANADSNVGPQ
jgi:hypothetical protein